MRASSPDSDYDDYLSNLKKKTVGNSNDFHIEGLSDISFSELSDKKVKKVPVQSKFIKVNKNNKPENIKVEQTTKLVTKKKTHKTDKVSKKSKPSESKKVEKKPKIDYGDSDPNFSLSSLSATPRASKPFNPVPKLQLEPANKVQTAISDDEASSFGHDGRRFFKPRVPTANEALPSYRDASPRKSTLRSARTPPSNKKVTIADHAPSKALEVNTPPDKHLISSSESLSEKDANFCGQMIMSLDDLGNGDEAIEEDLKEASGSECNSPSSFGEKILSLADLVNEDKSTEESFKKIIQDPFEDNSLSEIKTLPTATPRPSMAFSKDQSISEAITVPGTARSSVSKQYSLEFEESISKDKRQSDSVSKKSVISYSSDFTKEESSSISESVISSIKRKPAKEKSSRHRKSEETKKADSTTYLDPLIGMGSIDPPTISQYIVSPEVLESLTAYSPCMILLTNMMRHQLQMTTSFIANQRRLYEAVISSIKPSYNYCTLEDTKEFIRVNKRRSLLEGDSLVDEQEG